MQILTNRDKGRQVLTYFISIDQNVSQHLTYFICIGWNVCQNLHKLVNQRSLGVLAGTLINKLTLQVSNKKVI